MYICDPPPLLQDNLEPAVVCKVMKLRKMLTWYMIFVKTVSSQNILRYTNTEELNMQVTSYCCNP